MKDDRSFEERLRAALDLPPVIIQEVVYPMSRFGVLPEVIATGSVFLANSRFEVWDSKGVVDTKNITGMAREAAVRWRRRFLHRYPERTHDVYLIIRSKANVI